METLRHLLDIDCQVLLASLGVNYFSYGSGSVATIETVFDDYLHLHCPIIPGNGTMVDDTFLIATRILPADYINRVSFKLAYANVVQVLLQDYKLPGLATGMLSNIIGLEASLAAYNDTLRFQFMYLEASSDDPQTPHAHHPHHSHWHVMIESSLLMFAFELNNVDLRLQLLRRNASLVVVDSRNLTLLHRAVRLGNLPMIDVLLASPNPDHLLVQQDPSRGLTPLHVAIEEGVNLARLLLHSADPQHLIRIKDYEASRSALLFACSRNNLPAVDLILSNYFSPPHAPADLLERDVYARTALQHAIYQTNMPMIDALLFNRSSSDVLAAIMAKTGNRRTTLMGAAFFGFVPFMDTLAVMIDSQHLSSLMMATDKVGRTFLHFAGTITAAVFGDTVEFIMRCSNRTMLIHLLNAETKKLYHTPLDEVPHSVQRADEMYDHITNCLAALARHLDQFTIRQLIFMRYRYQNYQNHRTRKRPRALPFPNEFDRLR